MAVVGVIMGAAHTYVSQLEPTRMSFAVPAPHREVSHWHRMVKHAKVGRYLLENVLFSIQGNSGPMVLHKCLPLATCIHSKSNWVCLLSTEFAKNPENQTKFEEFPPVGGIPWINLNVSSPIEVLQGGIPQISSAFQDFWQILWKEGRVNWI